MYICIYVYMYICIYVYMYICFIIIKRVKYETIINLNIRKKPLINHNNRNYINYY